MHRLLVCLLVGLSTSSASAATYYVRKSGNDGNAGTAANQAWATIEHASTIALAGDTVYVGAGTYVEEIKPTKDGTSGSPIRFIADTTGAHTGDVGNVTVSGNGATSLTIDGDHYYQWTGFRFTAKRVKVKDVAGCLLDSCEIYSTDGLGVESDGATLTLRKCRIYSNPDHGIELKNSGVASIQDCTVYGNLYGIHSNGGTPNVTILRTIVHSNTAGGMYFEDGIVSLHNCLIRGNAQGMRVRSSATTVTAWHLTITANTGDGIYQEAGTVTLRNSIVALNSAWGIRRTGGTSTRSHNCISGNSSGNFSGTTQATGETTSDPRFWNATCLELKDGSPCINTGTATSNPVTDDIELVTRPKEGGYDMGCYETVSLSYSNLVDAYTQLNPYAWWRLNEASGTTAVDRMGNHPGSYQNGVLLNKYGVPAGSFNGAAEFDGFNDRVDVGNINPTVTAMSFVGWFRADTLTSTGAQLMAKSSGTLDSNYFWGVSTTQTSGTNYLRFRFRAGGSTAVLTATREGLSTGAWNFFAGTYDGTTMILYKDGAEIARLSKSGTPDLSGSTSAALGDLPSGSRPFDGLLDEMAIFTRALKPREIAAIYASSLKGSIAGTVSVPKLWGIDEDDAQLFSSTNYNTPTSTTTVYGNLKWNNGGSYTNLGLNLDACAINRAGKMYIISNQAIGTYAAPVLLSFNLNSASTTLPNVVGIIGTVPTSTELRGLAFDPITEELYALRSDGWLFVLNPSTASIVRTVGQVTGGGNSVTAGEDIMFDRFGNLYALDDTDDELYRVNKANGAVLGTYNDGGGGVGLVQGLAWDHLNEKMIVSVTDSQMYVVAPLSLTGYSFGTGLASLGLTDVEAVSFVPTEGTSGVYRGVRVVQWQEKK